jgi:ethanolamine ammonia-lyase large subunit
MSDADLTKDLLDKAKAIEKVSETIIRAAEGRRPLPTSLTDSLKQIGELTGECEELLTDYLDQPSAKETLAAVLSALNAIHGGIDSLIVFQALEGSSYSTITVAND